MNFNRDYMQIPYKETEEEKQAYNSWYAYYKACELFDLSIGISGPHMTREQRKLCTLNSNRMKLKYGITGFNQKKFQKIKMRALVDVETELQKRDLQK